MDIAIVDRKLQDVETGYNAEAIPLGSYALLMGAYATVFSALFFLTLKTRKKISSPSATEFALITVGSYKLSRIVTMSFIGSPVRAPFTERGESLKGGEVQDVARGIGLQKAIGNLVTCPFCFNVWSTTAFVYGFSLAPQFTIQAARILSAAAVGDVLHFGYRNLREKSE